MNAPKITLAQILATVVAVLGFAAAFGLSLTKVQQDQIVQVITVGYPIFLAADAYIRGQRSKAVAAGAKLVDGKLVAPATPPVSTG